MRRFAFRLALATRHVNVDAMLRQITFPQLREWIAFEELEPFGEMRDDYRMANMMQLTANMHRDTKKHPEPYTLSDFLFKFDKEAEEQVKPRQSVEEQKRIARLWAAVYAPEDPGASAGG